MRLYLPYCLEAVDERRHVVLNRFYKPLGMRRGLPVDYAPHAVAFEGLDLATTQMLSCDRSNDRTKIWLYRDGCLPTRSDADWRAYQERLQILASLKLA